MPCWESRSIAIEFVVANETLLYAALANLIAKGMLSLTDLNASDVVSAAKRIVAEGQIRLRAGKEPLASAIKQEYGRVAILTATERYGWKVYQKSPSKMTVTRRAF